MKRFTSWTSFRSFKSLDHFSILGGSRRNTFTTKMKDSAYSTISSQSQAPCPTLLEGSFAVRTSDTVSFSSLLSWCLLRITSGDTCPPGVGSLGTAIFAFAVEFGRRTQRARSNKLVAKFVPCAVPIEPLFLWKSALGLSCYEEEGRKLHKTIKVTNTLCYVVTADCVVMLNAIPSA